MSPSETLLEIRAIEQLKYRYMRALDTHDWALMGRCLAPDVRFWMSNGVEFEGRDAALAWLREVMSEFNYASHLALHPEIELTSPTTAAGIWRLQELGFYTGANPARAVRDVKGGERVQAAACYHEAYVKTGGSWTIKSTGYIPIFVEIGRPDFGGDAQLRTEPLRGVEPVSAS